MSNRTGLKIGMCILLAAGVLIALLGSPPPRSARAAGTFTVNSYADNENYDSVLTLREALLVANGSISMGLTDGEKAQLGGCIFAGSSGNWRITGGCGAGIADTINFSYPTGVITLGTTTLPPVNDTAPTYIYGPNTTTEEIAIDGQNLPAGSAILTISSDNNAVYYSLAFRDSPAVGIFISGSHNLVKQTHIYGNDSYGLEIDGGDFNEINENELGFRALADPTACVPATVNSISNILVTDGAESNTLIYNTAVCSPIGIALSGAATSSNTLQRNTIGVWYKSGFRSMGNNFAGIGVLAGSHGNQLFNNMIGRNQDGIVITGSGSNANVITNNQIGKISPFNVPNTRNGILIDAGTQATQVLNNLIALNLGAGVVVSGTGAGGHLIQDNMIEHNGAEGVLLRGSTSNNTLQDNDIFFNGSAGVYLADTVTNNSVVGGQIYQNTGAGIAEGPATGTNWWSQVNIYDNGRLGIDRLANGIPDAPYPTITGFASWVGGSLLVSGEAGAGSWVELYRLAPDPSGFGEGRVWVSTSVTNASGHWQLAVTGGGGCFTAFERTLLPSGWDSSEFGPNTSCVYLPFIAR